jgi:hypothetical protein
VHQVGHCPELHHDARSTKYKIVVDVSQLYCDSEELCVFVGLYCGRLSVWITEGLFCSSVEPLLASEQGICSV